MDSVQRATRPVATTIITRIEALRGRFDSVVKAADGALLLRAVQLLVQTENALQPLPILTIDSNAAAIFDRLRQDKKLKKVGHADLLIACIVLANSATLVTRNLKDFRQVPGLTCVNWAD